MAVVLLTEPQGGSSTFKPQLNRAEIDSIPVREYMVYKHITRSFSNESALYCVIFIFYEIWLLYTLAALALYREKGIICMRYVAMDSASCCSAADKSRPA